MVPNKNSTLALNGGASEVELKWSGYANRLLSGIWLWHLGLAVIWIHSAV